MDPQQGYPQQDLIVGQTIGNYLVTQKLGEGGMGAVYLAEHPGIGKKVALKVLHSEFSSNEDVAARFFNEAKAVNNIGHPNIVDIIDYGIIQAGVGREQLVYFIMEYLSGATLSQLIRTESPLPPERSLQIALQVADALSASHKCGIVHRDLKPDNIMLMQRGRERDFVKLLDFGIAKLTSNAAGSRRTRTGIVMGTPAYMSPEQCDGRGNIDHRTDIYALGIVVYEMLTGRVPFVGEGYGEILVQHLTQQPIPPSQFRMINPHVEAVIMKALEKRMECRYPNVDEMMRAMSDPVGFVESHGGIVGFNQKQLTPSNAPLTTSVRITTPPPLTGNPMPTPAPGMLTPMNHLHQQPTAMPGMPSPYQAHTPTPPPGMYTAAAAPTTLGGAAGALTPTPTPYPAEQKKSKVGIAIVAGVIVIGAVIAIAVVAKKNKAESIGADSGDSGQPVATPDAAIAKVVPPDAPEVKKEPVKDGSDGSDGSATTPPPVPVKTTAMITLITDPPGAKIYLDDKKLTQVTPEPFEVPLGDKPIKIVLKRDGYKDIVLDKIVPKENINVDRTFEKKRVNVPIPIPGKGSGTTTTPGKGSGSGKRGDDTKLIKPE